MSASMWGYAKDAETTGWGGVNLLEFGDPSSLNSVIWMPFTPDGDYLDMRFTSPLNGAVLDQYDSGGLFATATGRAEFNLTSEKLTSGALRDGWVHVFFAIDGQNNTTYTYSQIAAPQDSVSLPIIKTYINGVNRTKTAFTDPLANPPLIYFFTDGSTNTEALTGLSLNLISPPVRHDILNPWKISLDGFALGMPMTEADIPGHPKARYAETQIWFGTFIDPAVHISKFIDARGKPVDPAIPRAAFGAPDILFSRNKRAGKLFETNQGTAGSFTKIGTLTDFANGPF